MKLENSTTTFVAVITHQGPSANGMPELHKLSPYLGNLQNRGFKVALLTDGRMSGASGEVLAAIQVTPEANQGGPIAKIENDDLVRIDALSGKLSVDANLESRTAAMVDLEHHHTGCGRELFSVFRNSVSAATAGASIFSESVS